MTLESKCKRMSRDRKSMPKIYKDDWDVTPPGKMVCSIEYKALESDPWSDWIKLFRQTSELEIQDSYICDCEKNYGGRCKYPEKYRTIGCNGKEN